MMLTGGSAEMHREPTKPVDDPSVASKGALNGSLSAASTTALDEKTIREPNDADRQGH